MKTRKKIKKLWGAMLIVLVVSAVFLVFGGSPKAKAENPPKRSPLPREAQSISYSTISVSNPKIVSQAGNRVKLSFEINNKENIQPDIRYSVLLTQGVGRQSVNVDRETYDEILTVSASQNVSKQIEYVAPEYLAGKYEVGVQITNSKGLLFSDLSVGEIDLSGSGNYVEMNPGSCSLSIKEDSSQYQYALGQGAAVNPEESLLLNCQLKNNFPSDMTFSPQFKTFFRSVLGNQVSENKGEAITLKAGESKAISLTLSKDSKPQAYDVEITLVNSQNKVISNKIIAHYVLRGLSATVQNIKLNKDYYAKGEIAKASFYWTGPADSFLGSGKATEFEGGKMSLSLTNGKNESCSDSLVQDLEKGGEAKELEIPIRKDCLDPQAIVAIKDKNGNVLDEGKFSVKSVAVPEKIGETATSSDKNLKPYLFLAMTILTIILIIVSISVYRKKKGDINKNLVSSIIFLIASVGLFFAGGVCRAAPTWVTVPLEPLGDYNHSPGSMADRFHDDSWTIALDKAHYNPGETIKITYHIDSSYVYNPSCHNEYAGFLLESRGIYDLGKTYLHGGGKSFSNQTGTHTFTETAPLTPGEHMVVIYQEEWYSTYDEGEAYYSWKDNMHFIVDTPLVNGDCGTADGQTFPSRPTTGLCAAGNASPVPVNGTGPWTWDCVGSGGGITTHCWANTSALVNGRCGSADGASVCIAPTIYTDLCAAGTPQPVNGSGPWTWVCGPSGGGVPANCRADVSAPINGKCGPAYGQIFSSTPTSGLCDVGNASTVTGTGPWIWTCQGICSGSPVNCSANRRSNPWTEVTP